MQALEQPLNLCVRKQVLRYCRSYAAQKGQKPVVIPPQPVLSEKLEGHSLNPGFCVRSLPRRNVLQRGLAASVEADEGGVRCGSVERPNSFLQRLIVRSDTWDSRTELSSAHSTPKPTRFRYDRPPQRRVTHCTDNSPAVRPPMLRQNPGASRIPPRRRGALRRVKPDIHGVASRERRSRHLLP